MNKVLMDINDNRYTSLGPDYVWSWLAGVDLCVYTFGLCAVLTFKALRLAFGCIVRQNSDVRIEERIHLESHPEIHDSSIHCLALD